MTGGSYGGKTGDGDTVVNQPVIFIHGFGDSALGTGVVGMTGWSASLAYFRSKGYRSSELYATTWGPADPLRSALQYLRQHKRLPSRLSRRPVRPLRRLGAPRRAERDVALRGLLPLLDLVDGRRGHRLRRPRLRPIHEPGAGPYGREALRMRPIRPRRLQGPDGQRAVEDGDYALRILRRSAEGRASGADGRLCPRTDQASTTRLFERISKALCFFSVKRAKRASTNRIERTKGSWRTIACPSPIGAPDSRTTRRPK